MKRFALLLCTLVLTIQIAGCGGPGDGAMMTGTPHEDPNRPAEAKEFEAQKKAATAKKIADIEAKSAGKKAKP